MTSQSNRNKNLFLVLRNKKINKFEVTSVLLEKFANSGIYFDKVSYINFEDSAEITETLCECKSKYANTVIVCPEVMGMTLKSYISELYGAEFNELNVLKSDVGDVFITFIDAENKLLCEDVCSAINKKLGRSFGSVCLRTVCAPYEKMNSAFEKAKSVCGDLEFNVNSHFGDCKVEIVYKDEIPKSTFDKAFRVILGELNEYVYAIEDVLLAARLIQLLKLRRMRIAVAESFTGGGVGKRLVEISGASEVFFEGLNTYSNKSKALRLGVDELTLKHYGAVSDKTAAEMAEGLISGGNCDVAVSTTGIAGPKSDNTNKPVGLFYIGIATAEGVSVYKYNLGGSREEITETAINLALFLAFKTIK